MVAGFLAALTLTSASFHNGGLIPKTYTCEGRNISPPLRWTLPAPRGTRSFSLNVVDIDAHGFVHWDARGIPPTVGGLAAGYQGHAVVEGPNSAGTRGYTGPCPPRGSGAHRYVFTLRALGFTGRVLAQARLLGRFER